MQNSVLMGILFSLLSDCKLKAKDLSTKFEISPRTVYRYIDTLCASGVPICSSRGAEGGFYIENRSKVKNMFLTKKELEFLLNQLVQMPNKDLDQKILLAKIDCFYTQFKNVFI